jgi:hypothetical protein
MSRDLVSALNLPFVVFSGRASRALIDVKVNMNERRRDVHIGWQSSEQDDRFANVRTTAEHFSRSTTRRFENANERTPH